MKVLAALGGNWGYLCAAAGNVITFGLLFEPWLDINGGSGNIKSDAFGKFQISSSLMGLWSGSPPPAATINGTWAVLACAAIGVTVCTTLVNLRARTKALSHLTTVSSVAVALFIVFALVHMNGKVSDVRGMLGFGPFRDLGTQAGLMMRWASGNGRPPVPGLRQVSYTTAGLTSEAWYAGVTAVSSAVAAIAQCARNRSSDVIRLPLRIRRPTSTETPELDADPKQTVEPES
ncbi:hypothetical protein [Nocardia sp. NPDC057440]|uniref:hypothetical protein n=1 Tax=Nocardia sp. NPDC057440 TaxID=3346134 RepID=UPI003670F34B